MSQPRQSSLDFQGDGSMTSQTDYIAFDNLTSLAGLFQARVSRSPDNPAYRFFEKSSGLWQTISWQEMGLIVASWRQAIEAEKLESGDRVAIMMPNRPEWVAYEQAAFSLGLVVVPLYANDRPENIAYILNHTGARLLLCLDIAPHRTLLGLLGPESRLQRIVTLEPAKELEKNPLLISLTDWLPALPAEGSFTVSYHETASIVYTSGTTGLPKGVMLSHGNILHNCHAGLQCMDIYSSDTFLSFLPLSHMLERTAGYFMPMMAGACVTFARSIPDLAQDLLTIKPTVMVAVPRIFERIYGGIKATLETKPQIVKWLFKKAVEGGYCRFLHSQKRGPWTPELLVQPLLDRAIAKTVRARLGGRLRVIITGGAPLSAEISKFFIGLGLPLYQGYGLTETSPVISVNRIEDNRPEGVGRPVPGMEVKIGDHSELLVRGGSVMQGYWKNREATAATIDAQGWLHTGDKAAIEDGHIRIVGRLKEIIVLSNGEKVAPADLEMAISIDPLFEQTLVVGEGRPFLTLIAVLNQGLWEELALEFSVPADPGSLLLPRVREKIIERLNRHLAPFPGYVYIKDVALSLTPWTVEDGLLTPTLKLKRAVIEKMMTEKVNAMYG
jgi:long-chain acyl-CoA synthetase